MSNKLQIVTGATIFNGVDFLAEHALLIDGEKISKIIPLDKLSLMDEAYKHAALVKLNGGILTAGFVDFQVNGGNGVLLNDEPTVEGIKAVMAGHRKFGTTAMLPTFISDTFEKMQKMVAASNQALSEGVAGIVGLHLEGPYFNIARKGVHLPSFIRTVDEGAVELYKSLKNGVLMVTLAPEKAPKGLIKNLTDSGFLFYAGHSDATYDQIRDALDEGLSGFTHLFNAMSPLTNREPGVVGAAIDDKNSFFGLILDNKHVADTSVRIAIKAKQTGKTCLVTDAMSPVGAKNPEFSLYGESILVKDGYCITKNGTLAGSALDMATAVRNCHHKIGVSLDEALRMASIYPATALGLEKQIGLVVQGYQADLVHLDDNLYATQTCIKGSWEHA